MYRSKRRKPRVQWLPVLGNANPNNDLNEDTSAIGETGQLLVLADGTIAYDAFPVIQGTQQSSAAVQGSGNTDITTADIVGGNAYRLRRIVGKFHAAMGRYRSDGVAGWPCIDIACGFMVLRTDANGSPFTNFADVNPLAQNSANDPWIWRRRWILGNPITAYPSVPVADAWSQFPNNTADYGSVQDGPHIDQKTARIVGPEEALYCIIATRQPVPLFEPPSLQTLVYNLDIRVLGSMRTMQGNRRNSSR